MKPSFLFFHFFRSVKQIIVNVMVTGLLLVLLYTMLFSDEWYPDSIVFDKILGWVGVLILLIAEFCLIRTSLKDYRKKWLKS